MGLFDPKYHGADLATESGRTWQDEAERGLRIRCREQSKEIKRLEGEVRRLKRELKETAEKLALAGTLPMRVTRKEATR